MRERAITGFGIMLLFILAFAILFYVSFKTVVVSGVSMEETFHNGDRVLTSRAYWLVGAVKKNDVVVIQNEDGKGYIIKRVRFMPGEVVDYWNIPENWSLAQGEYHVPAGTVFVLGDNYTASEDSRKFGPVPTGRILGKVVRLPGSWIARTGLVAGLLVALVVLSFGISWLLGLRGRKA